jgi:hypothetical protein
MKDAYDAKLARERGHTTTAKGHQHTIIMSSCVQHIHYEGCDKYENAGDSYMTGKLERSGAVAESFAEAESERDGSNINETGKGKHSARLMVGSAVRKSREHNIPGDLDNDLRRNAESMGAREIKGHESQQFRKEGVVPIR